jgi:hypothetical protein
MRVRGVILASVAVLMTMPSVSGQIWEERGPSLPPFIALRSTKGMPTYPDGQFVSAYIRRLETGSSTFRDTLAALGLQSGVTILLAPSTDLGGRTKLIGRTRLRPSPEGFTAWMEILVDRTNPSLSIEAIGHEFGHVVEAACVGQFRSIADLRAVLRSRATGPVSSSDGAAFETPFPNALGREVLKEWQDGKPSESRFDALASRFGLARCRSGGPVARR